MLSIIIPAFNEAESIPDAVNEIRLHLRDAEIMHEILFVDDGSTDSTWKAIEAAIERSTTFSQIRGIRFTRNFGKEAAIFAGLEYARGACCVVIDCDLQHPPEKIVEMYDKWEQGYQVVEGVKASRGDEGHLHGAFSRMFYRAMSLSQSSDMSNSSDFKLLDRKVVDTLNSLPERGVFFRALTYWTGFKRAEVKFDVRDRKSGSSKWSGLSLWRYAAKNITSFTSAPLQLVTIFGLIVLVVSIVFSGISFIKWVNGSAVEGFTTVIILLLFMASIIMISLGIIGFYVARIFEEIKGRPRYIVSGVEEAQL